ncbi:hypothetical protein FQZ97_1009080 [compost metagenome]
MPAGCPARHLCPDRTRPHSLDQGLRATGQDDVVDLRLDHHRRHPDRPLAAVAAVRSGCDVGGTAVGVQGHPAVVRRQRATDQQRHAACRGLDRNAAGRRRWRRGGHHLAHGESAELRQDPRFHPHLAPDERVIPQLPRHAAVRWPAHQAQPVHRRRRRALPHPRRRTAPEPGAATE